MRIHSDNKIMGRTTQGEFKIQLSIVINFISSIPYSDETRTMRTKSGNIAVMMGIEVIEKLFKYFLQRYQERLEESMRGGNFIFVSVDSLYYDLNKISLNRDVSYTDSPEWQKNKKVNSKSKK